MPGLGRMIGTTCWLMLAGLLLASCGEKNLFQGKDKKDPAEDAAIQLERDNPDKAIDILTKALEKDPDDYVYFSLMSSALAEKHGIDIITLALKMAGSSSSKSEPSAGSGGITTLFSVLPDATDDNIQGITDAISWLDKIPLNAMTPEDTFKLSLFHTSLLALQTKKLDKNGDGTISPSELVSLDPNNAEAIVNNLVSAAEALGGNQNTSESQKQALQHLDELKAKIDAQPGETTADKLKSYLGQGSVTTPK